MLRFAITDRRLALRGDECSTPERNRRLAARCAELASEGVESLLIREKDLPERELAELSRQVVAAVRAANAATRILIAGRVDVALAVAADGVHLSAAAGELTPAHLRSLMPEAFVSVSCHTLEEVERARESGASAILFGPVFGKTANGMEVVPGVGLDALRQACALAGAMPVFALGGVTAANAAGCMGAGAAGVAAIRMFFG